MYAIIIDFNVFTIRNEIIIFLFNIIIESASISQINSEMKHLHFTNVIIYKDENVAKTLRTLIIKFENVFIDINQTINISKNQ